MGKARNNGAGDHGRSWWSMRSITPKGEPVPGVSSHRRWHKTGTGSNKAGLLTGKVPWENKTEAKRNDAQNGVNNTARRQAVEEGTAEVYEDEYSLPVVLLPEPSRHEVGYDWDPSDLGEGVTYNGMTAAEFDPEPDYQDYWPLDGAIDTINRLREQVRNLGGVPVA